MTEWWRKITWKEWEADLLWLCGKEKASEIGLTSLVLLGKKKKRMLGTQKLGQRVRWISWVLEERKSGQGVSAVG